MNNLDVNEYIEITRFVKDQPNRSQTINDIYSVITCCVDKSLDIPRLFICNTTDRVCEAIESDGQTYIIIDEYLLATFDELNRIMLRLKADSSADYVDVLFTKLSMEYLFIDKGYVDPVGIIHYACVFDKMRGPLSLKVREDDIVLFIQTFFVIYHEMMHILLRKIDYNETIAVKRRHFLDDYLSLDLPELSPEETVKLIYPIELQKDKDLDEYLRNQDISKLYELIRRLNSDQESYVKKILETRDEVIEECVCEQFAALATVQLFVSILHLEPSYIIGIIHLTILYLEILWLTRELLVTEKGPEYIAEKQIRKDIFKIEMPALIEAYTRTDYDLLEKCDSLLTEQHIKYTRLLKDKFISNAALKRDSIIELGKKDYIGDVDAMIRRL